MGTSQAVRDAAAIAALAGLTMLNRTCTFRNTISDSPITVVCTWDAVQAVPQEFVSTRSQKFRTTFYIPRQPNFPPTGGIRVDSLIVADCGDGSATWHVVNIDDGGIGALYELSVEREIPIRTQG